MTMPITYRKTITISLLLAIGIFVALPAVLVVAVDPCEIFHRPLAGLLQHGFSSNARCRNAGLINSHLTDPAEGFDTVLVGTSLSMNFQTTYIARQLHRQHVLKLTIPGGRPAEQHALLEHALRTGRVRHVLLEVFPFQLLLLGRPDRQIEDGNGEFPSYLYNRSHLDDYRYLFNNSTLQAAIGAVSGTDYYNIPRDIDQLDYWQHQCNTRQDCQPFHSADDIAELRAQYQSRNWQALNDAEIAAIDYSAVDRYLLSSLLPRCNSTPAFDLYFPPLSTLWYSRQDKNQLEYQLYLLRHLVQRTAPCHNIRIHAFDNEAWITGDLAHYHDPRHCYGGVHEYIIDAIARGNHIITPDNVRDFELRFLENLNNYLPWASTREQLQASPQP